MDHPAKCVFVPCGHVSCEECGLRLTQCHICRKAIELRQRCYFPWEEDEVEAGGGEEEEEGKSQPSGTPCPSSSSTGVVNPSPANDSVDGSTTKPQRTISFNVNEDAESDEEASKSGRSGAVDEDESSIGGGDDSEDDMHPGAFDFFHRRRGRHHHHQQQQNRRDRQQSSSTSSAPSTGMERYAP